MNIKQLVMTWLMLLSLLVFAPARAVNLSNQTMNGIQQNIKPAIPANTVIKKTSPVNAIHLNTTQACPKLFAKDLRVVRVIPQPARAGVQTYRFILDGNIANRGAAGVANAGFNVTQSVQGKPGKRIALKLFKQQVRKKQVLNVSRDLRVTIQSDALSRAQASRTVFKMDVTNLRNERGACGEYNATVSTLSAAQVSRALPAQVRGVSQQAGVIPPAARPPARSGFAAPALPAKRSLKTQNPAPGLNRSSLPAINANLPVPVKVHPVIPAKPVSAPVRPVVKPSIPSMQIGKQKPRLKPVQGFAPLPQATTKKPANGRNGFAPQATAGSFGLNKPVTATGGKSLLPPGATAGPLHVLGGDHAPRPGLGGFAPLPGVNAGIVQQPVTGPVGTSLLPDAVHGYAIKVSYKITDRSMTRVLSEVKLNQEVVLRLSFRNDGDEKSPRLNVYHLDHSMGVPELAPGEVYPSGFIVTITDREVSADGTRWLPHGFRITEHNGGDVTLLNSRNFLDAEHLIMPVGGSRLNVVQVSDIQLLQHQVASRVNHNLHSYFREDITARVKIKNTGNEPSEATTLTVTLRSTKPASAGYDPQVTFVQKRGQGSANQPLTYTSQVPSLSPGEELIIPANFADVPYNLMDVEESYREGGPFGVTRHTVHWHHASTAGAFSCGNASWESHDPMHNHRGWVGSEFSIYAAPELNGSHGGGISGSFGTTSYVAGTSGDFTCQVIREHKI